MDGLLGEFKMKVLEVSCRLLVVIYLFGIRIEG